MIYTHESKILNSLLGHKVKIKLWDGTILIGVLSRANCKVGYQCCNYSFRKTHVISIGELYD